MVRKMSSEFREWLFMMMCLLWLNCAGMVAVLVLLNMHGNRPDLTPFLKSAALVTALLGGLFGCVGVLRSK